MNINVIIIGSGPAGIITALTAKSVYFKFDRELVHLLYKNDLDETDEFFWDEN